jgi:hypothetical protein
LDRVKAKKKVRQKAALTANTRRLGNYFREGISALRAKASADLV